MSQSLYVALEWVGLRQDAGYLADTSTVRLFAYALLVIGPIEEFSKLILFVLIIVRFKEFDDTLDGMIYASFLARGFASPVVHIVFASIWGHWIATAHVALIGFVIAAILHGLYDFALIKGLMSNQ